MITKKELVKIVSKKAAVADTSAKELFDLFLRKIASELQPGGSARFSNVGHFYFRKGKVKKEDPRTGESHTEYLDLIIFSPFGQLDIKSAANLIFSVPDATGGGEDNLDSHFSLSVGKPVLPNLEGSESTVYTTDELHEILGRKVENLMINLHKDESVVADNEILLVDIKSIDEDQFELDLDQDSLNRTQEVDDTIRSSEQLKSIAWSFGKDLTNKIEDESLSLDESNGANKDTPADSEFEDRKWSDAESEINLDEESIFKETTDEDISTSEIGIEDNIGQVTDKSEISSDQLIQDQDNQNFENADKLDKAGDDELNLSSESGEPELMDEIMSEESDEIMDLQADEKIEDSIDVDKLTDQLMQDIDLTDLDIEMDDFEVTDNDEKMGKFERVRSISSSFDESKSIKDIEGFDNFIEDKIDIGKGSIKSKKGIEDIDLNQENFEPAKSNKKEEDKIPVKTPVKKKELKLNRVESKRNRLQYDRKNSTVKFLVIFAVIAGIVGVIYLLTKSDSNTEMYEEVTIPPSTTENTTYVERTYDIPVNYPYEKSGADLQVAGLGPPPEPLPDTESQENIVTSKPVDEDLNEEDQPVVHAGQRPPGTPLQAAYNIFEYGNKFVVQVSAFNSAGTAQDEVMKYASQGYNSFIERAYIDGKLWYRVRVGNFNSLDEAKQFRTSQQ